MRYLIGAIGALVIYDIVQERKRQRIGDDPLDLSLDLEPPNFAWMAGPPWWADADEFAAYAEEAIHPTINQETA